MDLDNESKTFEEHCDLSDLSFYPEHVAELGKDQSKNPFGDLDLECIGLCCFPQYLV
jgi:hypothetical protein